MPDPISWEFAGPYLLAAFAGGYLLGAVPFGLLLARLAGLGDIRSIGSGNIGATNVLRTGRKGLAAATLLLDAPNDRGGASAQVTDGVEDAPCRLVRAAGDHAADDVDHGVARQVEGGALGQWFALGRPSRQGSCDSHAASPHA